MEEDATNWSSLPPQRKIVVVVDTVGFLRALLNPGGTWGQIVFDFQSSMELVVCRELAEELVDVLSRPKLARRLSVIEGRDSNALWNVFRKGRVVRLGRVDRVSRDPDDDYLLALAIGGRADYIVTEDNDLLTLGSYSGISIITGREFLHFLRETERAGESRSTS